MSVSDIVCVTRRAALRDAMDGEPWQMRLDALGISQKDFAFAIGYTPSNLSTALRGHLVKGVPLHLRALIVALEAMTEEQRADWLDAARRERSKPKP